MSISEIKPGTKVHIEFDAVVEKPNSWDYIKAGSGGLQAEGGYGFLKVRDTEHELYHYVWAPSAGFNDERELVTVIVPPDWERYSGPQVGDIWEAMGREYFAYTSVWGSGLILFPVDGMGISYSLDALEDFANMEPRLVRRRGEAV